jgi:hypothetical protein
LIRWYFAIDEAGGLGEAGQYARLAVLSAHAVGGLDPVLLYAGQRNDFTAWMTAHAVTVIDAQPAFKGAIEAAEAAGTYTSFSNGHWLRVTIPHIEQHADYVLYTDCDVLFLRRYAWPSLRPRLFAAAPEFTRDNWNYFNSGVMLLNVAAMRNTYAPFEQLIVSRIGVTDFIYDDQIALNEAYRGSWDRLDPLCNFKPYWGFDAQATILHFHGPKLAALEAIAAGTWDRNNPTAARLAAMLDSALDGYIAWCNLLGDRLQAVDFPSALRCLRLASALTDYRAHAPATVDTSFRDFKLFP